MDLSWKHCPVDDVPRGSHVVGWDDFFGRSDWFAQCVCGQEKVKAQTGLGMLLSGCPVGLGFVGHCAKKQQAIGMLLLFKIR